MPQPTTSALPPEPWTEKVDTQAMIAGVLLSFIGIATFLLMPQLVESVVTDWRYTESEGGWMSSAVMIGSMVAAGTSSLWIRRISWRRAAVLSLLGQLAANAAGLLLQDPYAFIALQAVVGFCGGALYSLSLTILSDGKRPDRYFAYAVGAQTVYQVFALAAGPFLIHHGTRSILILFATLCLFGLILARWVPTQGRVTSSDTAPARLMSLPVILTLAGCFVFYVNIGAYWTYIERIGTTAGLSLSQTSNALALGVVLSMAGVLLAYWLGDRRGFLLPIIGSALTIIVSMILLTGQLHLTAYTLSAVLYAIAWNISMTYQYSTINIVDQTGRGVALAPAFHWAGGAVGPAIASAVVTAQNHDSVYWIVATAVLISSLLFAGALKLSK